MAYLVIADLRTATARFAGLVISTTEAADTRLTTVITEMSNYFDRLSGDHFEPTNATRLILDGNSRDAAGRGGMFLELPRRIRAVTKVEIIGTDATTFTELPALTYRVHSFFTEPTTPETVYFGQSGYDALELIGESPDPALTRPYGQSYTWPTYPRAIAVTGNWDWATTPELVAEAVAWLVVDVLKTRQLPARAKEFSSGKARFDLSKGKGEGPTGIEVVDRALRHYARDTNSIDAV